MTVSVPDAEGMRDTWANFDSRFDGEGGERAQAFLMGLDDETIQAALAQAVESHMDLWWAFVDEVKRTATDTLVQQIPAEDFTGRGEGYYVVTYGGQDVHAGPFATAVEADERAAELEADDFMLVTEVRFLDL